MTVFESRSDDRVPDVRRPGDELQPVDVVVQERALVARVRDGDERAFESLFTAYAPSLYSYAYRFTGSRSTAEELVHDMFAALWVARARWTVGGSVAAHLHAAVRNRALNFLRHQRHEEAYQASRVAALDATPEAPEPPDELHARDFAAAVRRATDRLPARRREVFLLHRQHGLTYEEIGAILGLSPRTVENHISNALKSLRSMLTAYVSITIVLASTTLGW